MIRLKKMSAVDFEEFKAYFVVDYALEIAANYGYSPEKSHAIATQALADDLPQTIDTPQHILLSVVKSGYGKIGFLWYKMLDKGTTVFILDFMVYETQRGKGYGKAAMKALQQRLAQSTVEQIKLRVAYHNKRALGLYQKLGFDITGYNMVKCLGS